MEEKLSILENSNWSDWHIFPTPKNSFFHVPFYAGVYQLRDVQTGEYILFGSSKHTAYRMSSLLPKPDGCGTRNNIKKQEYLRNHLDSIEYRTISFTTIDEAKSFENKLKKLNIHKFNQ